MIATTILVTLVAVATKIKKLNLGVLKLRVSKEKSAENREALMRAASLLFRQRGIDGVGVAEVAKAAGLTHGALYAHFPSKEALVAEAFSYGFDANVAETRALEHRQHTSPNDYLRTLFSKGARDRLDTGCPLSASASEIARQGDAISERFADAFEELVAMFEQALEPSLSAGERRQLAIAASAAQIGAIAVSRAVAKANRALSDEVLEASHDTIAAACKLPPSDHASQI